MFWLILWGLLGKCVGVVFEPEPFRAFQNSSTQIGSWSGILAEGSLAWKHGHRARFAVLPALVSPSETEAIRSLLPTDFDLDPDSVDRMTTFEFYLEKSGDFDAIGTIPGKVDNDKAVLEARKPVREQISKITRPIMADRVVPFVNQRYAEACKGQCTVCHSLVRRYLEDERREHMMHFDIQALVTVVVSLNADFTGGLYVTTGSTGQFVHLETGDAIIHQSDLLHGVQVESGKRWSWIMWLKDAKDCKADPSNWNRELADAGNPVGQFLQAHRVHMGKIGTPNPGGRARQKFDWLLKAAQGGFGRAQNEVGVAYKEGDGVRADLDKAHYWLKQAAEQGEGDAYYNLGAIHVEKGEFGEAVSHFVKGANLGSRMAKFNLGVAYAKGTDELPRNVEKALEWFQADGTAGGLFAAAHVLYAEERNEEAVEFVRRAAHLGDARAMASLGRTSSNTTEKIRWFRRAAGHGDSESMTELGILLRRQGNTEGRQWLERAALLGNKRAQDILTGTHNEL